MKLRIFTADLNNTVSVLLLSLPQARETILQIFFSAILVPFPE